MAENIWTLIQNPTEVQLALKLKERKNEDISFITTNAAAHFELMKYQVKFIDLYEFLSTKEYNEISRGNHDLVTNMTQDLDSTVHTQIQKLPSSFLPFEAFEAELKKFVDTASFYATQLTNFCNIKKPTKIYFWNDINTERIDTDSLNMFQQNSRILSYLLQDKWWESKGVLTINLPLSKNSDTVVKISWRDRIRNFLNPNRIEILRFFGFSTKTMNIYKSSKILVVGKCENLLEFVKTVTNQNKINLDWWTHFDFNPITKNSLLPITIERFNIDDTDLPLLNNKIVNQILVESNNDVLPITQVISQKIQEYWQHNRSHVLLMYLRATSYFQKYRPVVAQCGTADTYRHQIMRQAAQAQKIPFISFQHGGAYGYVETEWIKLSDLRADFYAGFGATGCSYLNDLSRSGNCNTKAFPLGWYYGKKIADKTVSNQSLVNRINQTSPTKILYIPTGLIGNMRYGPNHDLDDTEYCIKQIDIIETILQIPNVELTVKIHPKDLNPNPIPGWINEKNNPRLKFATVGKLTEILEGMDLAILDVPTTALIEIFATGTPLIYLDLGVMKWVDKAEKLFRKTTPWIEMKTGWQENLTKTTSEALKTRTLNPYLNPFLAEYASLYYEPQVFWEKISKHVKDI